MAYLLSSHTPSDKIPDTYIQPPERRGGPAKKTEVPIIDLSDEKNSISHIMDASKNIGCFQVINHGVPVELMEKTLEVVEELFKLPPDEKAKINKADDINKVCKMYTSTLNYSKEDTHSWRDVLKLNCGSLDTNLQFWPQNPGNFKYIVSEYVTLAKLLGSRLLDYLSQGLGLEPDYLHSRYPKVIALVVNHYPACPDPSLTIGQPSHADPSFINIIRPSQVPGLQVLKDGQWWSVETPSNAIMVFLGNQIEVVSNGKLKAVEHRVVSTTEARTSLVLNVFPSDDCTIGPIKDLVGENEKPLYMTYKYKDFFETYIVEKTSN